MLPNIETHKRSICPRAFPFRKDLIHIVSKLLLHFLQTVLALRPDSPNKSASRTLRQDGNYAPKPQYSLSGYMINEVFELPLYASSATPLLQSNPSQCVRLRFLSANSPTASRCDQ